MIVEKTSTTLVIRSRPWLEWLVGVLFIAAGSWAAFGGEPVFGGGFVLAGAVIALGFANTVTSRFDRTTGRFTRSMKGPIRRSELAHPLDQIASVRVEAGGGSSSSPSQSYRVVVVLKSRERVPISSGSSSGKTDKEALAAEIRRFLKLSDAAQDPPGFGEMLGGILDAAKAANVRQAQRDRR